MATVAARLVRGLVSPRRVFSALRTERRFFNPSYNKIAKTAIPRSVYERPSFFRQKYAGPVRYYKKPYLDPEFGRLTQSDRIKILNDFNDAKSSNYLQGKVNVGDVGGYYKSTASKTFRNRPGRVLSGVRKRLATIPKAFTKTIRGRVVYDPEWFMRERPDLEWDYSDVKGSAFGNTAKRNIVGSGTPATDLFPTKRKFSNLLDTPAEIPVSAYTDPNFNELSVARTFDRIANANERLLNRPKRAVVKDLRTELEENSSRGKKKRGPLNNFVRRSRAKYRSTKLKASLAKESATDAVMKPIQNLQDLNTRTSTSLKDTDPTLVERGVRKTRKRLRNIFGNLYLLGRTDNSRS